MITWGWTRVELRGAIERRTREGVFSIQDRRALLKDARRLSDAWHEVTDTILIRKKAIDLLARHPLRSADAGHLAAALLVAEENPGSMTMACLDRDLAGAAEEEGLAVMTWPSAG
jgi:predicted nucleic acid-binding protein